MWHTDKFLALYEDHTRVHPHRPTPRRKHPENAFSILPPELDISLLEGAIALLPVFMPPKIHRSIWLTIYARL
jgi:hypothetical protein